MPRSIMHGYALPKGPIKRRRFLRDRFFPEMANHLKAAEEKMSRSPVNVSVNELNDFESHFLKAIAELNSVKSQLTAPRYKWRVAEKVTRWIEGHKKQLAEIDRIIRDLSVKRSSFYLARNPAYIEKDFSGLSPNELTRIQKNLEYLLEADKHHSFLMADNKTEMSVFLIKINQRLRVLNALKK